MNAQQTPVLREVPGPSALGGGWRRSAQLLYLMALTDFKRTYFGTFLGYLWSLARPLMLFAVLVTVFTHIIRIGSSVPHYPVLLLMNIVLFGFFQEATTTAVGSLVAHEAIVRKTQFPRLVIPLSVVLGSLFNLALNLVVVLIFLLAFGVSPMWTWLLLPVIVLMLLVLATGVSMLVSSLYPRFRDIAIIWTVFCTALFYVSPVFYTVEVITAHHATLKRLILLNPLTPILELARKWMVQSSAPGPVSAAGSGLRALAPVIIYVAVCAISVRVFTRQAPLVAEQL